MEAASLSGKWKRKWKRGLGSRRGKRERGVGTSIFRVTLGSKL
jgi:hypothetical protein